MDNLNAKIKTARKEGPCQYGGGCKIRIKPGDKYIDPGESNPESAGGYGGYRYCMAHATEIMR
jgi:hypothetical protein